MIRPPATQSLLPLLLLTAACAGPGGDQKGSALEPFIDPENWKTEMAQVEEPSSTGFLLTRLDGLLGAWNNIFLTATDPGDEGRARILEERIAKLATENSIILQTELETGPPHNRQVAALALGFAVGSRSLSPLIVALEDPDPAVARNAAFGLGILGDPGTPLGGLVAQLRESEQPENRSNAAWALFRLLRRGAEGQGVVEAARQGLLDSEPGVRSHCVLILAHENDLKSVPTIALQLRDEKPHCARAASRALAYMGTHDPHAKGACARALTSGLIQVDAGIRKAVLTDLERLAGRNYGDDLEAWVEWAHRLPDEAGTDSAPGGALNQG
jgi:hypothetical protein